MFIYVKFEHSFFFFVFGNAKIYLILGESGVVIWTRWLIRITGLDFTDTAGPFYSALNFLLSARSREDAFDGILCKHGISSYLFFIS